ncbi:hypothetical protein QBC34DRAFT_410144 [Podospora aff. communis PSN243]|uniref:Uncharacterized protein n=1 Tax=Podospora aff. communis PSN243 TaxID=3040156 RepID=A0AAV9GFJ5_9PEZI|nr:hypothetical protein QBC34DRAFT_410144 [Podospora aff. communis PSN243]
MERCIAALRRGAAEYIVPQAVPGMVPEMRCFDPNRCACLDWGDKFPSNSKWACMPAWSGGDGCRGDVRHRLFSPSGDGSSSSDAETSTGEAHVAVSGLGNTFGEESRSSVSVTRCADMKRCIRFDYHRRIACSPVWQYDAFTTVDYSWLEAIDPDSYGLWKDKDTKGTLWCSTSSCPNYYRYLERPLVRSCCMAKGAIFKDSSGVKDPPFWIIDGNVYKLTNGTLLLINNKQFVLRVNNALPAKRQPAVSKTPSKPALPSARKPAPKPLSAPQSRRPRKNTKPSTWRKLTNLFRDNPQ